MRQKLSKILKLLALPFLSFQSHAQSYEWVKFFGGKAYQWPLSLNVDDAGNQYSTFQFFEQIKFDTVTLNVKSGNYHGLVVKQDLNGKVIWHRTMSPIDGVRKDIYPLASMLNSKGNLVVIVASVTDVIVGTDTIKRKVTITGWAIFRLEFNDQGKLINGLNFLEGNINFPTNPTNFIATDKNDNLYLTLAKSSGPIKVYDKGGTTTLSSSTMDNSFNLKFSNSGQKFDWVSYLPDYIEINSIKVDIDGNLYALGCWYQGFPYSFSFNGKKISNPQTNTGVVFIWDRNGKDKNWFSMESSSKYSTFYDITVHDSNSVLVSGMYLGDSAKFGSIRIENTKYGCYQFLAMYNIQGKAKWVKTEDTTYSSKFDRSLGNSFVSDMRNYKDSFYYVSLYIPDYLDRSIIFDGQSYPPNPRGVGINMKLDDKGNILWAFRSQYPFVSMGTDKINNLYFAGYGVDDTMKFGNFKSYANSSDGYIGKTFDYAIYRGDVYAGPYCAGDSLFVPYTKSGKFGDDNIFFAEISDEFGNFTGKERELGRLETNGNGTIRGVLPMFKVASGGSYRIRIRSTSPQAQSFYKFDKLRLLIYSRDKADPGPPAYVCPGDTIQLNTWGGTKWTWSPKYRMNDPSLRQPLVWPIRDTVYQIIIGDSSGCGAADTAYKKIFTSIKADFTANDICESDSAVFINKSLYAKSYYWKFGDGLISKKVNPKHLYNIGGISQTFNATLFAILGDACADSIGKAITINANPISDFSFTTNQNSVDFKATQSGNTSYKWYFGNGDSSSTKDINFKYSKSGKYTACLNVTNADGCFSKTCKDISITVGISSITKSSGFKIYPNPNTGSFTIEIENPGKEVSIEVYDMVGRMVKRMEASPNKSSSPVEIKISLCELTPFELEACNLGFGIYLVRVNNGGVVWNQKVIISFGGDCYD